MHSFPQGEVKSVSRMNQFVSQINYFAYVNTLQTAHAPFIPSITYSIY